MSEKTLLLFLLISSLVILSAWIFTAYSFFRKKRMSSAYGFLSITYAIHSLILLLNGLPCVFYIGFSLLWMGFHSIFRKLENIHDKNDINKKEDNLL